MVLKCLNVLKLYETIYMDFEFGICADAGDVSCLTFHQEQTLT